MSWSVYFLEENICDFLTSSITSMQYIIIKTNLSKSKPNFFFLSNAMYKCVLWIIDYCILVLKRTSSTRFSLQIKYISACYYTFNFETETRNVSLIIDLTTSIWKKKK